MSSRKVCSTGNVNPGMCIMFAPPKYCEKDSAFRVALIRITLRSGLLGRRSLRMINKKSSFIPRSWISSTMMWLTPSSSGSLTSFRSSTPVVQKRSLVFLLRLVSRRIWYPTLWPSLSPRSLATRSDTEIAEILLGCVQMMLQWKPLFLPMASSRMNCGTWVVLPHPVSPEITSTWFSSICRSSSSLLEYAGSFSLKAIIFLTLSEESCSSCAVFRRLFSLSMNSSLKPDQPDLGFSSLRSPPLLSPCVTCWGPAPPWRSESPEVACRASSTRSCCLSDRLSSNSRSILSNSGL
mmetsp:Transcript_248/g.925  ORF Transcript_248/g.925 Transcript_248/m.925 type:complete len:294 (-) Transcript_248:333-1214(-)